jgi:hypothetical protein
MVALQLHSDRMAELAAVDLMEFIEQSLLQMIVMVESLEFVGEELPQLCHLSDLAIE